MNDYFRQRRIELGLCLALFVAVFVVYGRTLTADFVPWDDDINIYDNPHLGAPSLERIQWMFTDFKYQWRYQPLSWLSWSIIYTFNGLKPFGYHLANVLLHGVNAALVFLLIAKLLTLALRPPPEARRNVLLCAALSAAVWAVHPLRVETVAWAVELLYDQAMFFLLLALLCYLKAHSNSIPENTRRKFHWASLILFGASLLSFPLAFAFVAVLVVVDVYPLKRFPDSANRWSGPAARPVWLEKIPFAVFTVLAFVANMYCRTHTTGPWAAPAGVEKFGVLDRIMQSFYVWAYYVWRPWVPFNLTPYYTQLIHFDPLSAPFVLSLVFVVGLSIWLFRVRDRFPAGLALWLCHLALLVPMLGLTEHPHYPSDRYSLIISLAWSILLAVLLWRTSLQEKLRQAAVVACVIIIAALGMLSWQQSQLWQSKILFYETMLKRLGNDPYRYSIQLGAGNARLEVNDFAAAEANFRDCIAQRPQAAAPHYYLATCRYQQGNLEVALAEAREAMRLDAHFEGVHTLAGRVLSDLGQFAEAETELRAAHADNPKDSPALMNLGIVCAMQGKIEPAVLSYQEAVKLSPNGFSPQRHAFFFTALALANRKAGKGAMAAKMAEKALSIARDSQDPKLVEETSAAVQTLLGGAPAK